MPTGIYPRTREHNLKNSKAHRGKIPWNKGLTGIYSRETLLKIGEGAKKVWGNEEHKQKMSELHKGKTTSEKHRRIVSEKWLGERNPRWNGGITRNSDKIRHSQDGKLWRKRVFERDNYTCVLCGARNGNGKRVILHADHIKPFAFFVEERFDINNGRTLCVDCHKKTDTYGGKCYNRKYEKLGGTDKAE